MQPMRVSKLLFRTTEEDTDNLGNEEISFLVPVKTAKTWELWSDDG